jgi:hypothetical protein
MRNKQSIGASPLWQNKQINKDSVAATNAWSKRKAEYMNRKEHMGKPISAEENLAEWNREKNEFYYDTQRNKLRLVPTDDGEVPIKGFKEGLNKWQLAPLNQVVGKYKAGDLLSETDWETGKYKSTSEGNKYIRHNIQDVSEVQEDEKGQFVTTVGDDEITPSLQLNPKPLTSSTIMPNTLRPQYRIARDTIRPKRGKVFGRINRGI